MTACNLSEWVVERIAEMKRRCPDVRVQGDDASMFEPYTADILEFVRRFGGLPQTPNMFLDPHPDFGGVSGWGGPPTILVPLAFGSEAVGTFLHEEGHWQCWFDQHTCRPWRRGVEIVNIAEGEICAETHALQELLALGDSSCIRIRLVLDACCYHTAPIREQRQAFWRIRQSHLWYLCETYAPGWEPEARELLARNGIRFLG